MRGVEISEELRDQILHQLDNLPEDRQRRVLEFARELVPHAGNAGTVLLRFSGAIGADDLREISAAIEEGCEKIDPDEW